MLGQQADPALRRQAQEGRPQQRPARRGRRGVAPPPAPAAALRPPARSPAEPTGRRREGAPRTGARRPATARPPRATKRVRRASWRRTISAERAGQHRRLQPPLQPHRAGQVVGRAPGLQLVEEPEPLLGEGQRQLPALGPVRSTAASRDRSAPRRSAPASAATRGRLEQGPQRQLHPQRLAHPRHHPCGQQRVAAEMEEGLRRGPTRSTSRVPRRRSPPGSPRPACAAPRAPAVAAIAGSGRARRSTLPVGVSGSSSRRTNTEGTSAAGRRPRKESRSASSLDLGDHVGHQRRAPGQIPRHHHRLPHPGMPPQRRLDLPRLDAEAADLHLVVHTAEELDGAVRQPAHQVARAVEPAPRFVRDELLGRQLGASQVAPGHAGTADPELTRHSHRHRVPPSGPPRTPRSPPKAGRSASARPRAGRRTGRSRTAGC